MRLNKIILFAMAISFLFITSSLAIIVNPPAIPRDFTSAGTYYHSSSNKAYFAVDHTMTFTQVVVASSYVQFNNTKFNVSSPNRINISLNYIKPTMTGSSGDTLVSFYAVTTTGTAHFNISGFSPAATYRVYRENASVKNATANATGYIYFNNGSWGAWKYYEISGGDDTPPTITINFVGNHSDSGGPYWLPPGEATALAGVNLNGYYTNDSYQSENFIYINLTVTDDATVNSVKLHWYNNTADSWLNTTSFVHGSGNYWAYNKTGIPQGKYSFDIWANDTSGNIKQIGWNKTILAAGITRRCVSLAQVPTNISYSPLYFYGANYSFAADSTKKDRIHHDQGVDGGAAGIDSGYMLSTIPTSSVTYRTCAAFVGYFYDDNVCALPINITNAYYHMWETSSSPASMYHYLYRTRENPLSYPGVNKLFSSNDDLVAGQRSNVLYSGNTYYLFTNLKQKSGAGSPLFTDNSIYELVFGVDDSNIKVISNRSFSSFILLNVPSNATLNATHPDTDGDGLSDWTELYKSYTNPFLVNTDNDGFDDDVEYGAGSDPNNYTESFMASPTVTTNASTGVEETNATLHGYILNTTGITSYGFQYGLTTGYGTSVSIPLTTETLRPTAAGDLTELNTIHAPNWGEVDEISADTTTYTYWYWAFPSPVVVKTDLYNIANTAVGAYPINDVIVYVRYKAFDTVGGSSSIIIKTGGNTYESLLPDSIVWTTQSYSWPINPNTLVAWTPADVDSLQIGIHHHSANAGSSYVLLTQAYVVVNYSDIPNTFSYISDSLTPGQLYHYRAVATNSNGTSYGADATFLTKPNEPTLLTATSINTTKISLTWTKGTGANNTMIRQKKGSYPTSYTDGDLLYNGTAATASNASLSPGTAYRYRAWSYSRYAALQQWSDCNSTSYELTYPVEPANATANFGSNGMNLNLSWDKGAGTNYTVILTKATGVPTSVTDGTIIYNGTGNYTLYPFVIGTTYYFKTWSFAKWTINPTIYHFSTGGTTFTITGVGGLLINCFDENDHHNLTFNVKVSNMSGSKVYQNLSATNTLVINASLCPLGPNIQVIVSATGYQQRIYTIPYLYSTVFYLLNTYLPPETAPGNGTENCELRPYIDSMTITNPAVDAVITFTHTLDSMISVELYNDSLYGTYGGWIFITSDNYTYTSTQLTVEHEIMDANTTMIRVNYYYNFCTGGVESALYNLRVVETIETGYTQVDQAVEGAFMTIKRYINASGIFVPISSLYTDANGYVNIYLVPDAHYKIFINKSGYETTIGDYIPAPPNAYGQTVEKIFRITLIESESNATHPYYEPNIIHFTGERSGTRLYVNYTDDLTNTTNTTIYIWQIDSNGTETLIATYNNASENTIRISNSTGINRNYTYKVIIYYTQTNFGSHSRTVIIPGDRPIDSWAAANKPGNKINNLLLILVGYNPFGWLNFLMFMFLVAGMYYMDERYAGILMMFMGGIFLMLNIVFGFTSTFFTVAGGALPAFFLLIGFLYEWARSKKRRMS